MPYLSCNPNEIVGTKTITNVTERGQLRAVCVIAKYIRISANDTLQLRFNWIVVKCAEPRK